MSKKKKYYIQLSEFTFYDSSPYTHLPTTDIYSFKTARKRDKWYDEFTLNIKGLLSHTLDQWRK